MHLAYKWQAALITAFGLFMAVLDNTIVNVALQYMRRDFNTDQSTIVWVVTGYFLSQAAIIPAVGYLSDRIGTKTVFLAALALFTVGSGLCALAPNEAILITCRVIQGLGGGALFPLAFAITFRVFPPQERGPASAVIGVPVLLAPVFGPTIGGLLTKYFDWRAIFTVNLPLGIIVFVLALVFLRSHAQEVALGDELAANQQKGFDVIGLTLAILGTVALVFGINEAGSYDLSDLRVWPFALAGAVLLLGFVLYELRNTDPVMDVRLFRNYSFAIANVLTWALSAFLFGSLFLLPIFFENVQGRDALNTGLLLGVQGLAAIVGVILAGRLYNVLGPRPLIATGLALVTVATIGFINLSPSTDPTTLQAWLLVRGLGLGMANIPLQTLALATISNRAMGRASSLVNVTRQIFSAIGISALTAYLTHQTTNHAASVTQTFQASHLAAVQAQCAAQFGNNPAAIGACVQDAAKAYVTANAVTMGLNDTFLLVMIGTGVGVVLALFAGRDPNVQKLKDAAKRGETVEARTVVVGE